MEALKAWRIAFREIFERAEEASKELGYKDDLRELYMRALIIGDTETQGRSVDELKAMGIEESEIVTSFLSSVVAHADLAKAINAVEANHERLGLSRNRIVGAYLAILDGMVRDAEYDLPIPEPAVEGMTRVLVLHGVTEAYGRLKTLYELVPAMRALPDSETRPGEPREYTLIRASMLIRLAMVALRHPGLGGLPSRGGA